MEPAVRRQGRHPVKDEATGRDFRTVPHPHDYQVKQDERDSPWQRPTKAGMARGERHEGTIVIPLTVCRSGRTSGDRAAPGAKLPALQPGLHMSISPSDAAATRSKQSVARPVRFNSITSFGGDSPSHA